MNDSNPIDSDLLSVTLDPEVDLSVPNGYVKTCKKLEPTDENEEAERVGVLDYMPSYRHRSEVKCSSETLKPEVSILSHQNSNSCPENASDNAAEATSFNRDVGQEDFGIDEKSCNDSFGESGASFHNAHCSASTLSDDDELLDPAGTGVEGDELQEVIVQSQQPDYVKMPSSCATSVLFVDNRGSLGVGRTSTTANREVATFFRCIPSRDVAWSNPDTARTSPTNSPEPVEQDPVALKNASYSVSLHSGGGKLCLADRIERQGQSSSQYQSPVGEPGKISEVHLGGSNLQPVEMLSVDRHQMEPNSLSRQNVVFLNEYPFWQSTGALYRDDSAAVGDRSEVEKRQERRDKRKKIHSLPVALAKDVAGYVGEGKTIEELIDYITRTDSKSKKLKQKASQHRQAESKKPPAAVAAKPTKAQASKTRPKLNKNTVSRKISDTASSIDKPVTSKPIEDSEMTLPGSGPTEILAVSDGSVWMTAPGVDSVSSDPANASEDANRRQKMSHKTKQQHSRDDGFCEDLSEDFVGGCTRTCDDISSEICSLLHPTSLSAPAVKYTCVESRNSSLQKISNLENCVTARTNAQIDTETATVNDGVSTQIDDSSHSKDYDALFLKVKEPLTSDQAASTVVLTPLGDHPLHIVPSFPLSKSASSSECSYQDETVLLLEENGPWEEFQSKKKRSRNHGQQSVVRNPMLSARRSSSSGSAAPVTHQKKTTSDPVSLMTRHTDSAIDVARGHRLPFNTGNSPKAACHGNVRSATEVDSNDKLSESTCNSSVSFLKSSLNNSHLGGDVLDLNFLRGTEFCVRRKDECATYARMASKDSNSVSFRSKISPSIGFWSYSKQRNEVVCEKNISEAEAYTLEDQTKKSSNSDRSAAALLEENKLGSVKKQQMEKKFDNLRCEMSEALDNKPNDNRLSASLLKANDSSDAIARPPVVFCGKVETRFSKESCGISFEYSDEPESGNAKLPFLGNELATGNNASDVRVASGCLHQVSKSCEASASGVVNCGRPIAPLSGSGHASSTKTPVLVVSPLPKVLQPEETTAYVVDTDPERLKEATACVLQGISMEAKEPASQISFWSALTSSSLSQDLVSVDGGVVIPSSLPVEIQEVLKNKVPVKVTPKKTHPEPNHARRAKPSHASNKMSTFNVMEAAQYLAVDWERLLSEGSVIYCIPD